MARRIRYKERKEQPLNTRQRDFCIYYVETGNALDSYRRAGYKSDNVNAAGVSAHALLKRPKIQKEIQRLMAPKLEEQEKHIATSQEVMQFFTDMMNGKIKDQFGLETSNSDRIKAAQEIAKRTVDMDNRASGKADGVIQIKLDWGREDD